MYCSREYINCEYIEDFDIDTRFFKLPVNPFVDLLEADNGSPIILNKPQIAIINAINDPRHRFVVACVSRRVGKSFVSFALAFLKALEPNSKVLIVAPNYSLAEIGWTEIKKYIKYFNLDTEKENAKDREIVLSNGTLIKLASAERADSAVGRSYDLIVFDEAALSDKGGEAFMVALRPTLDKPNSKAIFISTPRGSNYFKTFFEQGKSTDPKLANWVAIHGTWRDNPRASLEDIEQARVTNSDEFFRQEYEADFSVFQGRIYTAFSFDRHFLDLSEMDFSDTTRFETIMGIDHGFRDPTASVVIKYDLEDDIFYVVSEYELNSKTTRVHAERFQRDIDKWDIDMIFCDSAAAQFRADLAGEYDIASMSAKKDINQGINYVASLLEQDKIIVSHACPKLREMFINYRWDPKTDNTGKERPDHNGYSHLADALRYAIYTYCR
ncbi:terminase large subunit [Vibrio phage JSF12]|uniref:Terminase large subunit n=2 Tax=Jesfedecavirus TaxID=2560156 RepID=A0A2D0YLY7_9CAUD|nr:terminase large subunit [Vibrio phage JSF10]YP_009794785.1 terminase large subunit [Vibrio phage JSF12]ASV43479.1 terminase large subunit [Vibrio phage JSF10]ASV43620.1 terminase large subunit [Vibrio phage JSF12]